MVREKCSQHNSITCAVYFRHLTNLLNIYRWLKSCTNKFKLWFLFSQTKWGRCKRSLKMRQENVKRRWFYSESEGWLGSYAKGGRKKSKRTHTHAQEHTQTQHTVRTMSTDTTRPLCLSVSSPSRSLPPSVSPSLPPRLYAERNNEPCCTVLFTPASYQCYSSTQAANWKGQATVLPVPCVSEVGVYHHAPSTFLSRLWEKKNWASSWLPSQNNKNIRVHTHTHSGSVWLDTTTTGQWLATLCNSHAPSTGF